MAQVTASQVLELLIFLGGLAALWIKYQIKMKELEMRIISIEQKMQIVEKQDDKILEKLDHISEQITGIKIEMQNKEDRK